MCIWNAVFRGFSQSKYVVIFLSRPDASLGVADAYHGSSSTIEIGRPRNGVSAGVGHHDEIVGRNISGAAYLLHDGVALEAKGTPDPTRHVLLATQFRSAA
jgi:hypothetical protein